MTDPKVSCYHCQHLEVCRFAEAWQRTARDFFGYAEDYKNLLGALAAAYARHCRRFNPRQEAEQQ